MMTYDERIKGLLGDKWYDAAKEKPPRKYHVLGLVVIPFSITGLPDYFVQCYYYRGKWYDKDDKEIGQSFTIDRSFVYAWRLLPDKPNIVLKYKCKRKGEYIVFDAISFHKQSEQINRE